MEANEMCKLVTRKIAISCRCNFSLHGMSCIAHDRKSLSCLLKTNDFLTLHSTFNSDFEFDDVFVHVQSGVSGELRLIQKFITSHSPPRVFVLVDNAHAPTLKLLRAMGMIFIVSLRDSLSNIGRLLQGYSIASYMSPDLHAVIKAIQPAPVWAKEWGAFDGVQYFTPTETEIILDLLHGISPWQVARKRFVSVKTVSTHKLNALRKMELQRLNEFFTTPWR
ncbi:response regulator transcription factor [Salmonella enterica]|nr:response regulator transcription factor [Salmonella enterica]EIO8806977.1 response regulator transcription factor [Salmonella enterica]EIW4249645.1 response regulator transcription factor [Salmonella enterica]EIY5616286.1 response regulator transcription factor [Salmonella enterica]EJA6067051.1 response regulator transcription factor [Salmonella enterica]